MIAADLCLPPLLNKRPTARRKIDEIKLKIPLVSNLYKRLIVFRFTQNLGILLSNKVDMIKSFEIVKKIVGNVIIEEKIEEAAKKIREGASVSNSLNKSDFLPKLVLGMISAGRGERQPGHHAPEHRQRVRDRA